MRPATGRLPQGGGPYCVWGRYLPHGEARRGVIGVIPARRRRTVAAVVQDRLQIVRSPTSACWRRGPASAARELDRLVRPFRAFCDARRAGRRTTKRAPRPSSGGSRPTVPWWDSVTARTIERPRPLDPPRSLEPRKKRSNTLSCSSSGIPGPSSSTASTTTPCDALDLRLDRRAGVGVAQRVLHQVEDQPVQLVARAFDDHPRRRGDGDLVVARHGLELRGRLGDDRGQVDGLVRGHAARVGAREQQQVRDEAAHAAARSAGRRRRPRAARPPGTPPAARGWPARRSAACAARARRPRRTRAGG